MQDKAWGRIKPEIKDLITSHDYCMGRGCLLCAVFIHNRIKELTESYPKTGRCGEFAEVAVKMIPREEKLREAIRRYGR